MGADNHPTVVPTNHNDNAGRDMQRMELSSNRAGDVTLETRHSNKVVWVTDSDGDLIGLVPVSSIVRLAEE